ncbi:signal peptidase I [Candidatus Woesearchaeota archaeon]|nr:MAG: hypothetical protein QT09_C0001G0077 [archaeon GW2011_AR18]MBS3161131.1 signal peptidase I [Candidatus Woesearchaeota archaeon]HIH26378.1 signal peptidase I [Nanoarchaeota archaeon]
MEVLKGNFNEGNEKHRGWIIGHFIDEKSPFHSKDFEIKWGRYKKGDSKISIGKNLKSETLTIMIHGRLKIIFPEYKKTFILDKEGDYLFFPKNISHSWVAEEDCMIIGIRWPSIPNDQKIV